MKIVKITAVLTFAALVAGCEGPWDGSVNQAFDRGFGSKSLADLQAGIWVDPNGCDHWIIDDGIEGYLSQRLSRDGKPVCSGIAPPNHIIGDFQGGQDIGDPI